MPRSLAMRLARAKAEETRNLIANDRDIADSYILAADTVVAVGRRILGKPRAMNPFPLKNETIWEWGYNDSANQPMVFEAVMSPSGTVLRSASVVENASGAAGR